MSCSSSGVNWRLAVSFCAHDPTCCSNPNRRRILTSTCMFAGSASRSIKLSNSAPTRVKVPTYLRDGHRWRLLPYKNAPISAIIEQSVFVIGNHQIEASVSFSRKSRLRKKPKNDVPDPFWTLEMRCREQWESQRSTSTPRHASQSSRRI